MRRAKPLSVTIGLLTAAVAVLSIAGFFSQVNSAFDMLSHFRLVYIGALCLLCGCLALLRNWYMLLVGCVALVISATPVVVMYIPITAETATGSHSTKLRILQINPQADRNHQTDRVIQYALKVDPDILAITELSKEWREALKARLQSYRYQLIDGKYDSGIALFSKLPIVSHEVRYYPGVPIEHPQVECGIKCGDKIVTVILVHTTVPKQLVASRNAEMQSIAARANAIGTPVIVLGDFNCGPWSYHFEQLKSIGKLIDSEQGFGPQPSWTTEMIVPFVPIDHLLTSKDFTVTRRSLGPAIGSDHLPVYVELSLKATDH